LLCRKWSRSCQETLLAEAVMPRNATAAAVVLHRRTGCEDGRIEDIVDMKGIFVAVLTAKAFASRRFDICFVKKLKS
jgi:hypothetical protein